MADNTSGSQHYRKVQKPRGSCLPGLDSLDHRHPDPWACSDGGSQEQGIPNVTGEGAQQRGDPYWLPDISSAPDNHKQRSHIFPLPGLSYGSGQQTESEAPKDAQLKTQTAGADDDKATGQQCGGPRTWNGGEPRNIDCKPCYLSIVRLLMTPSRCHSLLIVGPKGA